MEWVLFRNTVPKSQILIFQKFSTCKYFCQYRTSKNKIKLNSPASWLVSNLGGEWTDPAKEGEEKGQTWNCEKFLRKEEFERGDSSWPTRHLSRLSKCFSK
jgi:hypothetical protein